MAQIIQKQNNLALKYAKCRNLSGLFYVLSFLCIVFFVICCMNSKPIFLLPALLVFCICIVLGSIFRKNAAILHSGIEGEEILLKILSRLPKSYCGFQNRKIAFNGQTSELDALIIGPTGIFVIENKHLNGTVAGNTAQSRWTLYKTGRAGGQYSKTFYNPAKQVGTHVYRLAGYLRRQDIHCHINAAVYFSNPDGSVQITGSQTKIPVFTDGDSLLKHIQSRPPCLSAQDIRRICTCLK